MRIPLKPTPTAQPRLPVKLPPNASKAEVAEMNEQAHEVIARQATRKRKPAGPQEPDGHYKQELGKPIRAGLVTAGMSIVSGARLYKVVSAMNPTQATDTKGRVKKAPTVSVISLRGGPTLVYHRNDIVYREIVESAKAE